MGDEQKRPKLLMWGWFKAPPGEAAPVDAFPPSFEEVPFSDEEDDDAAGTGGASPGASTDGSSSDEDAAKACSAAKGRYHRPWHNEKVKCVPVLALAGAAGLVAGGLLVHFIRCVHSSAGSYVAHAVSSARIIFDCSTAVTPAVRCTCSTCA